MLQLTPGGFLKEVVEDTTPVLGGNLDGGGHNISNVGTGTFAGLVVDTNVLVANGTTNRVGVGVAVPLSLFHVFAYGTAVMKFQGYGAINAARAIVQVIRIENGTQTGWDLGCNTNTADAHDDFYFREIGGAGDSKARIRIQKGTGNVGIDTDPNCKLDVAGAISSETLTITASADDTDVSGVNTLFVDTTSGDVTLGGLVGGVDGQMLNIVKIVAANDLILEHEEGIGGDTDDFFMHQLIDEIIDAGGVPVVFNGTTGRWYDVSHAKHV